MRMAALITFGPGRKPPFGIVPRIWASIKPIAGSTTSPLPGVNLEEGNRSLVHPKRHWGRTPHTFFTEFLLGPDKSSRKHNRPGPLMAMLSHNACLFRDNQSTSLTAYRNVRASFTQVQGGWHLATMPIRLPTGESRRRAVRVRVVHRLPPNRRSHRVLAAVSARVPRHDGDSLTVAASGVSWMVWEKPRGIPNAASRHPKAWRAVPWCRSSPYF
jgi:hypothetical protein